MSASGRWLAVIGGITLVVVAVSVAVAILVSGEEEFPDDSPEGAVQLYLRAVAERDVETATSLLAPALVSDRCDDQHRDAIVRRSDDNFRATLLETIERDATTEVRVRITETYGDPPFGGGESSWDYIFVLEQQDGAWRFTDVPWPLWCRPENFR